MESPVVTFRARPEFTHLLDLAAEAADLPRSHGSAAPLRPRFGRSSPTRPRASLNPPGARREAGKSLAAMALARLPRSRPGSEPFSGGSARVHARGRRVSPNPGRLHTGRRYDGLTRRAAPPDRAKIAPEAPTGRPRVQPSPHRYALRSCGPESGRCSRLPSRPPRHRVARQAPRPDVGAGCTIVLQYLADEDSDNPAHHP